MANFKRAGNVSLLLLLTAATGVLGACTLLLSKEPLTCATNADCAKFPGTVCDQESLECRSGSGSQLDGATVDGAADALVDGAIPFEGGDPCTNPNKPVVELKGDITANTTLKCDSSYVLVGRVAVTAPFTLTIPPNTTLYGDPSVEPTTNSVGTLLVVSGAKIMAVGEKDKPIVFTSAKKLGGKYAGDGGLESGDWGGVYLLGEAPINTETKTSTKASLGEQGTFGGTKTNSDSGHLEYVRIEYAGAKFPDGSDGTALELAGVGDATVIDHVMTRFSKNDCVEVIGGRAAIKHFLCQYPSDDGIAWELGWTGKAQFVVVQGRPHINDGSNGMQGRSGTGLPPSEPSIYNATFIGQGLIPATTDPPSAPNVTLQYGLRLEKSSRAHIFNSIFLAWSDSAIDLRGSNIAADVAANATEMKSCVAFGNLGGPGGGNNIAFIENAPSGTEGVDPTSDDDNGFDEIAWWKTAGFNNSEADPGITKALDPNGPVFHGGSSINAATSAQPPNDGFFDPTAKYVGAFKDSSDLWATGKWVLWSDH